MCSPLLHPIYDLKKEACSKKHTQLKIRVENHTLIMTKMAKYPINDLKRLKTLTFILPYAYLLFTL